MDENEELQDDLNSHPCPQCGCELPDDASDTMGLCQSCYEANFLPTDERE